MPASSPRRLLAAASAAIALMAGGAAVAAETTHVEQLGDDVKTAEAVKKGGFNLLVVPIPVVDPALGNGLTLATGVFYSPVEGGRQWVTGGGGMYTSNGDWALGIGQQADLMHGKLRLTAFGGYGDFNLDFFGIGQHAGASGLSVKLDEKGTVGLANVLYQVSGHLYVGARYRFMSVDSTLAAPLRPDDPVLPPFELKSTISGLGPSFEYDTRDSEFNPRKGTFISGQWLFNGSGIGSDFGYDKLNLASNLYLPINPKTVLALRASLCHSSDGAPFYDLCFFGSQHDLRGYEGGRYRDHAMGAVQAEVRRQLFGRFGAVAFAGFGSVAPDLGGLIDAKALPSAGFGLRYQPSKKIPVNVSVDYAWGDGSSGLYLYVGEAF